MTEIMISVEHLSKRYQLGIINSGTFKDDLNVWWARKRGRENPLAKIGEKDNHKGDGESIWALWDINFEVKQGEALGIIGRNGAGKSTLLKILSRVTAPTEGRVRVNGRIASLLEVGTGFHPELTGRENIFLNGAIMGMSQAEVNRKLDAIIDFSGVEKYIDTPVKRYSSGMYVRLAFAVAAHLEPEILVVDEVLAVGDAEFQKKCLGKMDNVRNEGRTILYVSHNMSSMISLCSKCILLKEGRINTIGKPNEIISDYLNIEPFCSEYKKPIKIQRGKLSIERIEISNDKQQNHFFKNSETLILTISVLTSENIPGAQIAFDLYNNNNECIFCSSQLDWDGIKSVIHQGRYDYFCQIPLSMFREGRYKIVVSSSVPNVEMLDSVSQPLVFQVFDNSSPMKKLGQDRKGIIINRIEWEVKNY